MSEDGDVTYGAARSRLLPVSEAEGVRKLKRVATTQPVGRWFITFLIQEVKVNLLRRRINYGRRHPMQHGGTSPQQ